MLKIAHSVYIVKKCSVITLVQIFRHIFANFYCLTT